MYVDGLHGDEGAQLVRTFDHSLSDEPRIHDSVVRVDEDAPISGLVTPVSYGLDMAEVFMRSR